MNQSEKRKKSLKIVFCLLIVAVLIIIIGLFLLKKEEKGIKEMICTSSLGTATFVYDHEKFIEYKSEDMKDVTMFLEQYEAIENLEIKEFLKEVSTWYYETTQGVCKINGKEVKIKKAVSRESKTIGNKSVGYLSIPKNWEKVENVEEGLSYSDGEYTITLKLISTEKTADEESKEYIQGLMGNKDILRLTGTRVVLGKEKEYITDQVHMYYPSTEKYLITYWFEDRKKKVHYISLEGPLQSGSVRIMDYFDIPRSFKE